MAKNAIIHARTEAELKKDVEAIFKQLGLSTTEAINLFYHQVKLRRGLPFKVEIPNNITLKTFKKTDAGEDLIECKDTDDLFAKLDL